MINLYCFPEVELFCLFFFIFIFRPFFFIRKRFVVKHYLFPLVWQFNLQVEHLDWHISLSFPCSH